MQKRVQQLWIPGFLTLTISAVFLMKLQQHQFQPRVFFWGATFFLLYTPWLVSLPVFGAIGAFLSVRAGGSWRAVLLATIFPILTYAAAILVILPISVAIDTHVKHNISLAGFARGLFEWVIIPGAALLAGGLPTWFFLSRRLPANRVAGS